MQSKSSSGFALRPANLNLAANPSNLETQALA
jgi:hypothetical protein